MPNVSSSLNTTQNYIPLVNATAIGKAAGLYMHFPSFAAFQAAVVAEQSNIAGSSATMSDGQPISVTGEPATRIWTASPGHARKVKVRNGLIVTLAADSNAVLSSTGAPSGGTGANGDIAIDYAAGNVYTKSSGSWSVTASTFGAASIPVSAINATGGTSTSYLQKDGTWSTPSGGGGGGAVTGWNIQNYGGVPIDPATADTAAAADTALWDCFMDAWVNEPSGAIVIDVDGTYALDRDPSQIINTVQHYCMFALPLQKYNQSTPIKTVTFRGRAMGMFDNSVQPSMNAMTGCGFYARRIESTARGAFVFGYEKPVDSGTFESFNYTPVTFENITLTIKTHSGSTQIANNLSGIDCNDLTYAVRHNVRVRTSSPYGTSVTAPTGTIGIREPRGDNHAILSNTGVTYVSGFDKNFIGGEHSTTALLISVIGNVLTEFRGIYPYDIGQLCLEGGVTNMILNEKAQVNIGALQTENYTGSWYANSVDIAHTGDPTKCHLTVGQYIGHGYGGASVPLTLDSPYIDIKVGSDENGINQLPDNVWTTATRPATMLRYGGGGVNLDDPDNPVIDVYTAAGWKTVGGGIAADTTKPTFISATVQNATPTHVDLETSEDVDSTWPAYTAFAVTGHTVSACTVTGARTAYLTVDAFSASETRTLSYTKPGTNNLKDLATTPNEMDAFTGFAITDNVGIVPLVQDDFNRANSSTSLGNTIVPGTAWAVSSGAIWGIQTNKAYCPSAITGSSSFKLDKAFADAGVADFTITVKITVAANGSGGVIFRHVDNTNFYYAQFNTISDDITLYLFSGSSNSVIGSAAWAGQAGIQQTITVNTSGNALTVSVPGFTPVSVSNSAHNTATNVGIAVGYDSTLVGSATFDDFNAVP